jgi:hypothetical protein
MESNGRTSHAAVRCRCKWRFENKTATRLPFRNFDLPFRNKSFELVPVDHIVNEIVSLVDIMRLKVDNNDVEELVEEHRRS